VTRTDCLSRSESRRWRWRRKTRFLALSALAAVAGPGAAVAVDWDVQPSASTQVTVSDNIDLDTTAESGAVFRATAGTSLRATGRRLSFNNVTSLSLVRRTDRSSFDLDHQVNAVGSFEFVQDRLGVDASLSSARELTSSEAPVSGGDSGSNLDSRTTVTSASLSPYWQQRYGRWAQSLVRYRHTEVVTEGNTTSGSSDDSLLLQLVAGDRLHPWRPAVTTQWIKNNEDANDAGVENDLTQYSVLFFNQFALSRRYSITASVGYDEIDAPTQTRDLSGMSWTVGVVGTPGPRSSFNISLGQRYNDLAVNGSASYALTSNLSMELSASHSLSSGLQRLVTERNFITADPVTGELATPAGLPVDFLNADLDDDLALRQDVQLTLIGQYGRNNVIGSLSAARDDLDTGEEQSVQGRVSLSRQLNRWLTATAGGSYSYVETALDRTTHTATASFNLSYQLGRNTSLFGGYAYTNRRSSVAASEYSEHSATIGGRVNF